MKIISKFKDYYDHLAGIYGMDEKLVLDRTDYIPTKPYFSNYEVVRFCICDMVVEGMCFDGKFLYGEQLVSMALPDVKYRDSRFYVIADNSKHLVKVLKVPTKHKDLELRPVFYSNKTEYISPNDKYNCPILRWHKQTDDFAKFPVLSDYQVHKVFTAQEMWIMLTEWLGREKVIPNKQTDKEKILSNGFDLKTSFRNPVNKRK